jgi:hypothetical protein
LEASDEANQHPENEIDTQQSSSAGSIANRETHSVIFNHSVTTEYAQKSSCLAARDSTCAAK